MGNKEKHKKQNRHTHRRVFEFKKTPEHEKFNEEEATQKNAGIKSYELDLYGVLELTMEATDEEIKMAYYKKAKE